MRRRVPPRHGSDVVVARLEPPAPIDGDALANLVASRTQEKLGNFEAPTGVAGPAPVSQGFTSEGLAELETRMSRVFRAAAAEQEPEDLSDMQDGIRKVVEGHTNLGHVRMVCMR